MEIATADGVKKIYPPNRGETAMHVLAGRFGGEEIFEWRSEAHAWFYPGKDYPFFADYLAEQGFRYCRPWSPGMVREGEEPVIADQDEPVLINVHGQAVKRRHVPERVQLEDQTVRDLIDRADAVREQIATFKARAMDDVAAFLQLLAERYNVKRGGRRDGVQLTSFDGLLRVEVSVADTLTLGAELSAAKDLIDQCITRWSNGANGNLTAIVNSAFAVGESGKLRVDRIVELRRLEIEDDTWREAMRAIGDALRVQQSRSYIRFYRRANMDARFEQITLDLSRV